MRQIVLDTETTGLEPALGHRIIEIGCVEIVNRRIASAQFQPIPQSWTGNRRRSSRSARYDFG